MPGVPSASQAGLVSRAAPRRKNKLQPGLASGCYSRGGWFILCAGSVTQVHCEYAAVPQQSLGRKVVPSEVLSSGLHWQYRREK